MGYTFNADDYKNAKTGGERLAPGGHECIIKAITLGKSKNGKEQFTVQFDTADTDLQPGFYMNRYLETKKWAGNYYLTAGNDYFISNVKKLCGAVEASNDGFIAGEFTDDKFEWYFENFRDVKVGIVFREEEYEPSGGVPDKWPVAVKAYYFCDVRSATSEKVPAMKKLDKPPVSGQEGFMSIPDNLEGLPFR